MLRDIINLDAHLILVCATVLGLCGMHLIII